MIYLLNLLLLNEKKSPQPFFYLYHKILIFFLNILSDQKVFYQL